MKRGQMWNSHTVFLQTLFHTTYTHRHLAPTHLTQTLLLIQSKLLDPRIENTTSPGGYFTREGSRVRCYSGTGFRQTKFRMSFSRLKRREEGLDGGGGGGGSWFRGIQALMGEFNMTGLFPG